MVDAPHSYRFFALLPSRSFSDFSFSGRRGGWDSVALGDGVCMCAAAESVLRASGGAGGGMA